MAFERDSAYSRGVIETMVSSTEIVSAHTQRHSDRTSVREESAFASSHAFAYFHETYAA